MSSTRPAGERRNLPMPGPTEAGKAYARLGEQVLARLESLSPEDRAQTLRRLWDHGITPEGAAEGKIEIGEFRDVFLESKEIQDEVAARSSQLAKDAGPYASAPSAYKYPLFMGGERLATFYRVGITHE